MRQWLKDEEKFKEWQNLEMQWIQHHDPILEILDDEGATRERVDLTQFSFYEMEGMLRGKGFRMKGES